MSRGETHPKTKKLVNLAFTVCYKRVRRDSSNPDQPLRKPPIPEVGAVNAEQSSFAAASAMIAQLPLSDAEKAEAVCRLLAQTLMTHARIIRLNTLAVTQTTESAVRALNEAADRVTNTYRRLMQGLADYRRPPRTGDVITAIK